MAERALEGKVFAITGAASGIGYAVAFNLFESGASLILADVQAAKLKELKDDLATKNPEASSKIFASTVDVWDS